MVTVDQIAKELDQKYKNLLTHLWVQYTTGFDLGVQDSNSKINDFKSNPNTFKVICDVLEKSSDPLELRCANIMHRNLSPYHQSEKVKKLIADSQTLQTAIMDKINKFRIQIDGKEISSTEAGKILTQSDDRNLREKVYRGRLPLNQIVIDAGFLKLIDLRKEIASASGSKNFIEYKLKEEELSSELFSGWLQLCNQRQKKYNDKEKSLAQKYLNLETLAPWDHGFLKSKICHYNETQVDLTQFFDPIAKTFSKFGFDIKNLNLTFDIFPRKNKSEWGYNFTFEKGLDSRILANVSNQISNYWVLLHETAHGVHFLGLNPKESALNFGVSGIVAEGFANFFGNLMYSKEFLTEVLPADIADKALSDFKKLEDLNHFQNYRSIPDILFDQKLYTTELNSENDIQNLKQDLYFQTLGEEGYPASWARLIHHTSAPIYLHNYFLGDLMNENMKTVFEKNNPGKTSENSALEFGQFWKNKVLAPSGRYSFTELYEKVCEEKLSIENYIDNKCLS